MPDASWWGLRYLPAPQRRIWLVVVLATLGAVVLLRVLLLDTIVRTARREAAQVTTEWPWSSLPQSSRTLAARIKQQIQLPIVGVPYNLTRPTIRDHSQNQQSCFVASLFSNDKVRNHTFVEAGAYNGEDLSNSLYLERDLGWSGLLVEADPWNYWALTKRARNAATLNACVAPHSHASKQKFKQSDTMGRLSDSAEVQEGRGIFTSVVCYPLYSIMRAANFTSLDYLALDLEGLEMKVLETVPWDKVNIKVVQVETSHLQETDRSTRPLKHRNKYTWKSTTTISKELLMNPPNKLPRNSIPHNTIIERIIGGRHNRPKREGTLPKQEGSAHRSITNNCDGYRSDISADINIALTKSQRELLIFFKRKGYKFLKSIGEDYIFTRLDFVSNV